MLCESLFVEDNIVLTSWTGVVFPLNFVMISEVVQRANPPVILLSPPKTLNEMRAGRDPFVACAGRTQPQHASKVGALNRLVRALALAICILSGVVTVSGEGLR